MGWTGVGPEQGGSGGGWDVVTPHHSLPNGNRITPNPLKVLRVPLGEGSPKLASISYGSSHPISPTQPSTHSHLSLK